MPGLDGTGPMGAGPMTGGARGLCNPSQSAYGPATAGGRGYFGPSYAQGFGRAQGVAGYGRGFARGFRGGFGPGFGWGRGYGIGLGRRGAYPPPAGGWYEPAYNAPYGSPYTMTPEDEVNMLRSDANAVKSELDAINKRIEELEAEPAES